MTISSHLCLKLVLHRTIVRGSEGRRQKRRAKRTVDTRMIGMVLVTHGRLASEFRSALEHVVGPQRQLGVITIDPDDDMDGRRQDIVDAIHSVDTGEGVVVLTDMFGGTPSNLAISAMNGSNVEVVAGINLPMLIKLASVREDARLPDAVLQAQEAGRKYINIASRVLSGK
jgi:mannose PTS system EIIA component